MVCYQKMILTWLEDGNHAQVLYSTMNSYQEKECTKNVIRLIRKCNDTFKAAKTAPKSELVDKYKNVCNRVVRLLRNVLPAWGNSMLDRSSGKLLSF